jgi:hypothetical protein
LALCPGGISAPNGPPTEDATRLQFQNVQLQPGSGASLEANVVFDLVWSGETFPGVFECTWRALGPSGSVVGHSSDTVLAMMPVYRNLSVTIPVRTAAATVEGTCHKRLDVGEPYAYEISNIRVEPESSLPNTVRIVFDARWLEPATPGPVTCTYSLFDTAGSLIVEQRGHYVDLGGSSQNTYARVTSASLAGTTPVPASISCHPFTG